MEHPVLTAIRRASFVPFGWFEPRPEDGVPGNARFVILIGNAGPEMFARFAHERDPSQHTLDQWTEDVVGALARDLDAVAVYPFSKRPFPFLTWARRAGAGHVSPLGLNIHPVYGLWHAYRGALLFPAVFDFPQQKPGAHPCETCAEKPCLSSCPVDAFSTAGYDTKACARHLARSEGRECMESGCLARWACPVGREFRYHPRQARFHMDAFLKARMEAI
jgi:epoxyqueuosine reductase QueG